VPATDLLVVVPPSLIEGLLADLDRLQQRVDAMSAQLGPAEPVGRPPEDEDEAPMMAQAAE
jgi:hypothetical protein